MKIISIKSLIIKNFIFFINVIGQSDTVSVCPVSLIIMNYIKNLRIKYTTLYSLKHNKDFTNVRLLFLYDMI